VELDKLIETTSKLSDNIHLLNVTTQAIEHARHKNEVLLQKLTERVFIGFVVVILAILLSATIIVCNISSTFDNFVNCVYNYDYPSV
jgi:hypothetical protein